MSNQADLHNHTHYSDGLATPEGLVQRALRQKLSVMALTDHDTLDGVLAFQNAASGTSLTTVPGCEFSTLYKPFPVEVHLLGFFPDGPTDEVIDYLGASNLRQARLFAMVDKLQALGYSKIHKEELPNQCVLGRKHLARLLVQHGYFKNESEPFYSLLAPGGKAYVPKQCPPLQEVLGLISRAKGLSSLAHPTYLKDPRLFKELDTLQEWGLLGIEVQHPRVPPALSAKIQRRLAGRFAWTGGTDYHGDASEGSDNLSFGISMDAWAYFLRLR